jgi:chromosome segregation ATPase
MNPAIPTQQAFCYNCHAPLVSPGAAFCDTCGAPQRSFTALSETMRTQSSQVKALEQQKNILENQIQKLIESENQRNITLQTLESKRTALLAEIGELENSSEKTKALTGALQTLTAEVESLRNKKLELTKEVEALTGQIEQLEIKRGARKSGLRSRVREVRTGRKELRGGIKRGTHTFICKYEGKGDWSAELAKLIAQFELSLDHTNYSFSPEKISFTVIGSRGNIEKLAAALTNMEGFVNLRSKLAETKRSLRESINARNVRKEQLDKLSKAPWYRSGTTKSLTTQKTELGQQLATDELRIKALTEAVKGLESLLRSDQTKN